MVCVVEMNEIENANSGSSMVICILNATQTSKPLYDSGTKPQRHCLLKETGK